MLHTGIDIVDIFHFSQNLKSKAFIHKVFTEAEIRACEKAENTTQCYANKFAIKEAFMKALGAGIRQEVWFTQIEILGNKKFTLSTSGRAQEILLSMGETQINISLAKEKTLVIASVLIISNS